MHSSKNIVAVIITIIVLIALGWWITTMNNTPVDSGSTISSSTPSTATSTTPSTSTSTPATSTPSTSGVPASITGEFTCLPHRNTSGPQTMECAFGLKDAQGNYYALNFNDQLSVPNYQNGEKYVVKGKFVSFDKMDKRTAEIYNVMGLIQVESVTK